ncbi:MAG: hypothetical protein NC095_00545 [Muribaculum sp.]|nr:hypothetical protein [Muribaculum sp.]
MSEELQYVILGVILLLCVAYIAKKVIRTKGRKSSGCCGCSLQNECKKHAKDCYQEADGD